MVVAAVMAAEAEATAVAAEATAVVVVAADTVADVAMAAETSGAAVNQQRLARSIYFGGTGTVPSDSSIVVIRPMG